MLSSVITCADKNIYVCMYVCVFLMFCYVLFYVCTDCSVGAMEKFVGSEVRENL